VSDRFHIKYFLAKSIFFLTLFIQSRIIQAQVVAPFLANATNEFRRDQLTGKAVNDSISLMLLPLNINNQKYSSINVLPRIGINMYLLPIQHQLIYNHNLPYQLWNSGSFLPSRGLQSKLSFGLNLNLSKYLTIQIHPEYHYAENKDFDIGVSTTHQRRWAMLYLWYNNIDRPQKYGDDKISRLLMTQSFAKVNVAGFSFGLSNENLWWGPGKYTSIIMSDNAIGFTHFSFTTNTPKSTKIGNFEMQLIAGKLLGSSFYPPDTSLQYANIPLYHPKTNDWRLLTGLTINYHPKWIKGLYIGYSKTVNQYFKTARDRAEYFELLKFRYTERPTDLLPTYDKISSLSLRWLVPEANFEFYWEYGWNNDNRRNPGVFQNFQIGGGYLIGFSKLFALKNKTYLELNTEVIKLQQPPTYAQKNIASWYAHPAVRHGHTNQGEVIGSAAGPGSNIIFTNFSWIGDNKKFGLDFERITNNNDFIFYEAGTSNLSFTNFWIDYGIGSSGSWDFNNLTFTYKILKIYSFNYEWGSIPAPEPLFSKGKDRNNIFFTFSHIYRF